MKLSTKRIMIFLLLTAALLLQAVLVYLLAFIGWQGPGDFGSNYNYVPAVMIASGRGFVDVDMETITTIPALEAFIKFKTTTLDPDDLPGNMPTIKANEMHGIYRYLLYTVGFLWQLFGISWNVVRAASVFILFVCAGLVYAISRLLLPPVWSLIVVHAFLWNGAVLSTMTSFRDFSKALFILAIVYILGKMIQQATTPRRYFFNALMIGTILGVGMGFRRDMQIILPISLLLVATCRLQPERRAFIHRVVGASIMIAVFVCISMPILIDLYPQRWVNAHDTIMGFSTACDKNLGILAPASYEKHSILSDPYATQKVWSAYRYGITRNSREEAAIVGNDTGGILLYRYILHSISIFPADFLSRAYAAVLRCCTGVERSLLPPFWILEDLGFVAVVAALAGIAAMQPYKAWQILLMLCLFCGCTSIQYGTRHAFHMTFLPYLFCCYVLFQTYGMARSLRDILRHIPMRQVLRHFLLATAWIFITAAAFLVPLKAARIIQDKQVTGLEAAYQQAQRTPVDYDIIENWDGGMFIRPKPKQTCSISSSRTFYEYVDVSIYVAYFDPAADPLQIDIIYDWMDSGKDLSSAVLSHIRKNVDTGNISLYFPVYEISYLNDWNMFAGLHLPRESAPHFLGLEKLDSVEELDYFLNITLPEDKTAFIPEQRIILPWPCSPRNHLAYRQKTIEADKHIIEIIQLLEASKHEEAARLCRQTLKIYPDRFQLNILLAHALLISQHEEEGWKIIEGELSKYGENVQVYRRLNLLFKSLGDAEKRLYAWERVLQRAPESVYAKSLRDEALTSLLQDVLAQSNMERCRQLLIEYPEFEPGILMADNWFQKNGTEETHAEFWQYIAEHNPSSVRPYLRFGVLMENMGNRAAAAEAYAKAHENDPENTEAAIRYAAQAETGLSADAVINIINTACLKEPDKQTLALEYLEKAAASAEKNGAYEEAAAYYQQATHYAAVLNKEQLKATLQVYHARAIAQQGEIEQALELLKPLLILNSDNHDRISVLEYIFRLSFDKIEGMINSGKTDAACKNILHLLNIHEFPKDLKIKALEYLFLYGKADEVYTLMLQMAGDSKMPKELRAKSLGYLFQNGRSPGGSTLDAYVTQHYPELAELVQQELIEEATAKMGTDDFRGTEQTSRMAIRILPETEICWSLLGNALEQQGKMTEALEVYNEGILKAKTIDLIASRLNILLPTAFDGEAITRKWQEVYEARPDNPSPAVYYAAALEASGHFEEAAQVCRDALTRFPENAPLSMQLARALVGLGNIEEGLALIDKAAAADNGLRDSAIDTLIHASDSLHQDADPSLLENIFSRLARLNPESAYFLTRWAEVLFASGEREKGIAALQQAVVAKPESDALQAADRVRTLMTPEEQKMFWGIEMGRLVPDGIQNLCASGITDDKMFVVCYFAEALAESNQAPEAIALLSEAKRCFPENVRIVVALGLLECRAGNVQNGINYMESLLQQCPQCLNEVMTKVETIMTMLTEKGQFAEKELLARFLMKVEPDNLLRHFQLAESMFRQKKYDEAIHEFEYVLLHAPESPRAAGMMNEACDGLNSPEICLNAWQRIIEANPNAKVPQQYREGNP